MIKTHLLALFAVVALSCGISQGQTHTTIAPSDLGLSMGTGPINQIFDISSLLNKAAGSVTMEVTDGFVNAVSDSWTVSNSVETLFEIGGSDNVNAFVQHGSNLGSDDAANGPVSRDGIRTGAQENWTLVSSLDANYAATQNGNTYFVDWTGGDTGQIESNSTGFRWESDQVISEFTVFSANTLQLNNNYSIGFSDTAVPEPSTGVLVAVASSMLLMRRKRK